MTSPAHEVIEAIRMRYAGIAVGTISGEGSAIVLDEGRDQLQEDSVFEFGSMTKTMTALILATAVHRGELGLQTTVGNLLGTVAGRLTPITLLQLATHTAGLPRDAPNAQTEFDDPGDPFARYDENRLLNALPEITPDSMHSCYSNFGFQLLGYILERSLETSLPDLFRDRIFLPLGMENCRVQQELEPTPGILPGYRRGVAVPHWHLRLPGPGGVTGPIGDLVRYVGVRCGATPYEELDQAVALATTIHAHDPDAQMGLGWMHIGGGFFHGGLTAGFSSVAAFHPPSRMGVVVAMNTGDASGPVKAAGLRMLNQAVR